MEIISSMLNWLQDWGPILLSLALVLLYYRQTSISDRQTSIQTRQQELLEHQLNREFRQSHTETLRERVRAWHGDLEENIEVGNNGFEDDTNLPRVKQASVQPAPPSIYSAGDEPDFRVVPEDLEADRYLQDLLENHAPELRRLKEDLEAQYKEFDSKRERFVEEYSGGPSHETDQYDLKPTNRFNEWVFRQTVSYHRKHSTRDKQKLRSIAEDRIERSGGNPDRATLLFTADSRYTYECMSKSGDFGSLTEIEDDLQDLVLEIYYEAIDEIGSDGAYQHAVKGAKILDSMEEDIRELEMVLIEYEGRPVYPGSCKYLDEASP